MHGAHPFLLNLATVLCVAALATVVFQRLRQPLVLGYILAGLLVGPHLALPLVADHEVIEAIAELGVTLLMFSIGLEFRLPKLLRVLPTSGLVALVEVSLLFTGGFLAASAFGWSTLECLFTGAVVSISSTSIVAKAFETEAVPPERREVVFGVLIVEDLLAILMMVALAILAAGGNLEPAVLGTAALRLGLTLLLLVGAGLVLVPPLFRYVVALRRPETTTVAAVGFCFAAAMGTVALGYPGALGAFVAGMLVAESGHGDRVEHLVKPVRDVFAAIFFVAVGMLLDPAQVLANPAPVAALVAVVLVGKVFAVSLGAFLVGHAPKASIHAGMSLAQIGEFSFIIAGLGLALGATGDFLYPVAISVSAITTLTTPLFIRAADRVADRVDHKLPHALQTLAALYGGWLEALRNAAPVEGRRARLRAAVTAITVDALGLLAVIVSHALFAEATSGALSARLGVHEVAATWGVSLGFLALAAPLYVGIVRACGRLGEAAAEPLLAPGSRLARIPAIHRVLVTVLQLGAVLAVGLPMVAITQPFLPPLGGALALLVVQSFLAVLVWRRASAMEGELRSGAQLVLDTVRRSAAPADTAPAEQGLLGAPVAVTLSPDDAAVGHTLVELNLRSRTGATVIGLTRRGQPPGLPTGREALAVGDTLAVAGAQAAVAAALLVLRAEGVPPGGASTP